MHVMISEIQKATPMILSGTVPPWPPCKTSPTLATKLGQSLAGARARAVDTLRRRNLSDL